MLCGTFFPDMQIELRQEALTAVLEHIAIVQCARLFLWLNNLIEITIIQKIPSMKTMFKFSFLSS